MAFSMMSKSCGVAWTNNTPKRSLKKTFFGGVKFTPNAVEETSGGNADAHGHIGCAHKRQSTIALTATAATATTATAATATAT